MNSIIKCTRIFLILLLITKCSNAQDLNIYQASDAVMLQVNDDMHIESRLKSVVIALSNNSNQLSVRLNIPYPLINYIPADKTMLSSTGLLFNLKVNINPSQIQDYLTSTKTFVTQGFLTLNNTTNPVKVQYIPLPAGTDQDGDFNLSMVIQFNADDFNLDSSPPDSQFIIKINDATVNRV